MFEPERYRGSIELVAEQIGAEVYIDGKRVGVIPLLGPLTDLPAGEHTIEVKKKGFETFSRRVRVPMSGAVEVKAVLPPVIAAVPARRFWEDWPFWTASGVGVVAVIVAGLLHRDAIVLADNADACAREGLDCAKTNRDKSDSRYIQAYVMYGLGGAGLAAAGLIALIDGLSHKPTSEKVSSEPGLGISPATRGLGLTFTLRF